jgi:O-antigen ligase
MRLESLQAAWPVLLQRPLFGWGLLMAGPVLTAHLGHPSYVDDTYLTWLVELGMIGVAAFTLLILSALRMAVPLPRSPARLSRVFALVMLVGMVVFASFLSITQGYAGFVLIFTLVTLGAEAPAPEMAAAPA